MTNSNTLIKLIEDIYQQNMGYDFTFLRAMYRGTVFIAYV
ncbi:hypothetical protein C799_01207 [Bacteroides thetaiotaomicron dnLKV9]|uniref:Uncharacterized protein n=1 Tax=Bacteroides thetaiotaomicron dnLKV9 TaxID=1235785 RepID=R9HE81_BACT4|nr:hypothetical protein C799_01207 [Bacteroides thetaiotaomicron dnLKV9]